MQSQMPFDVFISYSSEDKLTADAACAALEGAGIRCWIAPRDIRPGGQYGTAIINAIDSCRVMVLIFSLSANASRQVPREIERAVSKGVPIVPIRIEEVAPTESMAYFLDSVHWLDALTPPLQKHLEFLVDSVRSFLAVPLIDTSTHAPDVAAEAAMSQARDRAGQHDAESKAATKRLDNSKGDVQSAVVQGKLTHERRRIVWKLALTLGLYFLVAYAFELYLLLRPPSAILGVETILGAIGGGAVYFIISGIIPTIVWAFSKFRPAQVGLPLILWAALGILVGLLAWLGSPGGVFGGK